MSRALLLVALLLACGGSVQEADDEVPMDEPTQEAPVDAEVERVIPLCPGAAEPEPGDCQRLVYGDHGYCNRWLPCDELH